MPIISYEEEPDYAVELAFVSRNVIIEGADDEGNSEKGGYMQILHTPYIVQTLDGVEFLNMGRKSEHDRFVSILYWLFRSCSFSLPPFLTLCTYDLYFELFFSLFESLFKSWTLVH